MIQLYVDIADDLGAGSGEGNLQRISTINGTEWTDEDCFYLVPEKYFINMMNPALGISPFNLQISTNCK